MTITQALAEHAATAPRAWPDQVRRAALRAVIDTCACMIAGRGDPDARAVSSTFARWQAGGALDLVAGQKTAAPWAAMVNATAAHALDYGDVLETAAAHAVVYPSGHPQAPMSDADLARKFKDCAKDALSPAAADAALEGLLALECVPDVDAILAALIH